MDTWYFSPFPDEYAQQRKLYICEFTLKYMKRRSTYLAHCERERSRQPPGQLIYRCDAPPLRRECLAAGMEQPKQLSVFEINGSDSKVYCQCLCLLAKLFLDHKTLYYDVEPFLFYIITEAARPTPIPAPLPVSAIPSHTPAHTHTPQPTPLPTPLPPAGRLGRRPHGRLLFKGEGALARRGRRRVQPRLYPHPPLLPAARLRRADGRPPARAAGDGASSRVWLWTGKLMIAFSYELSRRESKMGTPERPISDLGLVSYRSYWVYALLEILHKHRGSISVQELSERTAFRTDDIVKTLQAFNLIRYFGGQHSILVTPKTLEQHYTNAKPNWIIDSTKLRWTPYHERPKR